MKRAPLALLALLLLVLIPACSPSPERLNNRGNRAFDQEDYETALQDYLNAQVELPEQAEPGYNAANTHFRQGDLQAAQQRLLAALQNAGESLSQFIHYNLGNIYFHGEQYDQAVERYAQALRFDPDDLDAKYNLELALQKLQEQEQAQPEQAQDQQDEPQQHTGEPTGQPTGEPSLESTAESPSQIQPTQRAQTLSEQQARLLLDAAAEEVQSLQEYLQQIFIAPGGPPSEDW